MPDPAVGLHEGGAGTWGQVAKLTTAGGSLNDKFGFAVAVGAENARGLDGALGGQQEPWYVDEFGHPYFEGAGRFLATLIGHRLGTRVRYEKPGTIQRSKAACGSWVWVRQSL